MVGLRAIKSLSERRMQVLIIFAHLDIKVWNPAQLAIDVTLLCQLRILGHAGAFHFVLIVGVHRALWVEHDLVSILRVFAKVLLRHKDNRRYKFHDRTYLEETFVLGIPAARRQMVPAIPLTVLQGATVHIVLHDLLLSHSLACPVLEVAIGEVENLFGFLSAQR